jgi:polyisoprenoid-binding protein YceI
MSTKWTIDPQHSVAQFKVKHLAVSTVTGQFNLFEGSVLEESGDFDGAKVALNIDANSLDTNHAQRDGHLKGADFFSTEQFPHITFSGVLHKANDGFKLEGALTIRDVTKPITLDAELTGTGRGRFGDTRAGFEVDGKINRKDFGLTWTMLTDTGGLVVGEEVKLHFDVQLIREA